MSATGPAGRRSLLVVCLPVVLALGGALWWSNGGGQSAPTVSISVLGGRPGTARAPSPSAASGLPVCSAVPTDVTDAVAAVRNGGPYLRPGDDGGSFGNREGLLPTEPYGYYREYTVRARGVPFPGPRRLITGGQTRPGTEPQVWFYTADHYESFCELVPG